jgi:hypothetical protein
MLTATVSGSFHRHMEAITSAVHALAAFDVRVLSPADPRIVEYPSDFLFVASDLNRSVRLVQDRHLEAIRAANFLWLVCPDGYVGQSASMEIGYAAASGIPIFAAQAPSDLTLCQYVKVVPTLAAAVNIIKANPLKRLCEGLLINPHASLEQAHVILERVEIALTQPHTIDDPALSVHRDLAIVRTTLSMPTYMH